MDCRLVPCCSWPAGMIRCVQLILESFSAFTKTPVTSSSLCEQCWSSAHMPAVGPYT